MFVGRGKKKKNRKLARLILWLSVFFFFNFFVVSGVLAQTPPAPVAGDVFGLQPVEQSVGLSATDIRVIAARIIRAALGLLGVVALALMLYGGYVYMTAAGNEEKIGQAKKVLINAAIGLAIILSAFAIVQFALNQLGVATGAIANPNCANPVFASANPGVCGTGGGVRPCVGNRPEQFVVRTITPSTPAGSTGMNNVRVRAIFSQPLAAGTVAERVFTIKRDSTDVSNQFAYQYIDASRSVVEAVPKVGGAAGPITAVIQSGNYQVTVSPGLTSANGNGLVANTSCGFFPRDTSFRVDTTGVVDSLAPAVVNNVITFNGVSYGGAIALPRGRTYVLGAALTDNSGIGYAKLELASPGGGSPRVVYDGPLVSRGSQAPARDPYIFNDQIVLAANTPTGQVHSGSLTAVDIDGNRTVLNFQFLVVDQTCVVGSGAGTAGGCRGNGGCANNAQCLSGVCNQTTGQCVATPLITDVNPWDGAGGNWVTVLGHFFGATAGQVDFGVDNNNDGTVDRWVPGSVVQCAGAATSAWQDNWIIVEVPRDNSVLPDKGDSVLRVTRAGSGNLSDTTTDNRGPRPGPRQGLFRKDNALVRPGLCSVTVAPGQPSPAVAGATASLPDTAVIAQGQSFGAAGAVGSKIDFGGIQGAVSNWTASRIDSRIPKNLQPGTVAVTVTANNQISNGVPFRVLSQAESQLPVIESVSPKTTTKGSYITITGQRFGSQTGVVYLAAPGTTRCTASAAGCDQAVATLPAACGQTWTDTQVVVQIPTAGSFNPGQYTVIIQNTNGLQSQPSGADSVTVTSDPALPSICALSPASGPAPLLPVGGINPLTITGINFSNRPSVYFWGRASQTAQPLTVIELASWLSTNGNAITYQVVRQAGQPDVEAITTPIPVGTSGGNAGYSMQTGPIVVASQQNKVSNQVKYQVADCRQLPVNQIPVGQQCCALGPAAGILRPTTYVCPGEIRTGGYVWRFTTGKITNVPYVVEECNVNTFPSPTPWAHPSQPEGRRACLNRDIAVRFNLAMDPVSFAGNVKLYTCDEDQNRQPDCAGPKKVDISNQINLSYLSQVLNIRQSPLNGTNKLLPNTWYHVELLTGIQSLELVTVLGSAQIKKQPLQITNSCGRGTAYCFDFKTGDVNNLCSLQGAVIQPPNHTTNRLGPVLDPAYPVSDNQPLYYYVSGRGSQSCSVITVDGLGWQWGTFGPQANSASVAISLAAPSYTDSRATATALQSTAPDSVTIQANLPPGALPPGQTLATPPTSDLNIDLGSPSVVEFWPNCQAACANATIGVKFSRQMDDRRNYTGGLRMFRCVNQAACNAQQVNRNNAVALNVHAAPSNRRLELHARPVTALAPDTWYWVEVLSTIRSVGQVDASGEILRLGPSLQPKSWAFKTRTSGELCVADSVRVEPDPFTAFRIGEKAAYRASPFTQPDQCSPIGQALDPWSYGWFWSSANANVASVSDFRSVGLPKAQCTLGCLLAGSDIATSSYRLTPTTVPYGNLNFGSATGQCGNRRIDTVQGEECDPPNYQTGGSCSRYCTLLPSLCGNGRVDLGEDCEIGLSNERAGKSCGLDCTRPGNTTAFDRARRGNQPDTCGNSIIEASAGEECEVGVGVGVNRETSATCSAICQHLGLPPLAQLPADQAKNVSPSSYCGNGTVDPGEDCDLTFPGETAGVTCSDKCLRLGQRTARSWCDVRTNASITIGLTTAGETPACASAASVCGNGVVESGEECEVVGAAVKIFDPSNANVSPADSNAVITANLPISACSGQCLLQDLCDSNGQSLIASSFLSCARGTPGCANDCTLAGSSVARYLTPSVCGDAIVGTGEFLWCELSPAKLAAAPPLGQNPIQVVTAIGQGAVREGKQSTAIQAALTRAKGQSTDLAPAQQVRGQGAYALQCGFTEYQTPRQITSGSASMTRFNDCTNPVEGVARNSCCYPRPKLTSSHPADGAGLPGGTTAVCRNTYISITLDGDIDEATLTTNLIIAEGHAEANYTCQSNSEQDVTVSVRSTLLAYNGDSPASANGWWPSLWQSIRELVRNWFAPLARASLANDRSLVVWCAGKITAVPELTRQTNASGQVIASTIALYLNNLLDINRTYAVVLRGGLNGIKDARGVGVGVNPPNPTRLDDSFIFRTGADICKLKSVSVSPASYLYSVPDSSVSFAARAESTNGQPIVPIRNVYDWIWSWAPLNNPIFSLPAVPPTCGNTRLESGEDCEGGVTASLVLWRAQQCATVSGRRFTGGTLACEVKTCVFDTSQCTPAAEGGPRDASTLIAVNKVEGTRLVSAKAHVVADVDARQSQLGQDFAGMANLTASFCENPWPPRLYFPYEEGVSFGANTTNDGTNAEGVFNGSRLPAVDMTVTVPVLPPPGPVSLGTVPDPLGLRSTPVGSIAPSACTPTPGLVSLWSAEGNANDSVGSNNGRTQGRTSYAPSKSGLGQAFKFDGAGDRVVIPANSSLDFRNAMTLTAWIRLDEGGGSSPFFAGKDATGNSGAGLPYHLRVKWSSTDPTYYWRATNDVYSLTNPLSKKGKWVHVAGTFQVGGSNDYVIIYINGVEERRSPANGGPMAVSAGDFFIGNAHWVGSDQLFIGLIDEVVVFNRALSASEVATLYNSGGRPVCAAVAPPPIAGSAQYFNFKLNYCADAGKSGDQSDDLPYLKPFIFGSLIYPGTCLASAPAGGRVNCFANSDCLGGGNKCEDVRHLPNETLAQGTLKRFLFFNSSNDDVIGVQIFQNPKRLSVRQWFEQHPLFGGTNAAAGFQTVVLAGYEAITDGNNYYVNGLNETASGAIFNNIYLFSINPNAQENTKQVFQRLLKSLEFNINVSEVGYCLASAVPTSGGVRSRISSELINISNIACRTDFDCLDDEGTLRSGTNGVCSNAKTKLLRDWERLHRIREAQNKIEADRARADAERGKREGEYRRLLSGTYIPGKTISRWPSWGLLSSLVGGLRPDPINQWSKCGICIKPNLSDQWVGCVKDVDCQGTNNKCRLVEAQTCWDTETKNYICPRAASVFEYEATTANYLLRAPLEYFSEASNVAREFIPNLNSFTTARACPVALQPQSPFSEKCGDGILNLAIEQCDPPGDTRMGTQGLVVVVTTAPDKCPYQGRLQLCTVAADCPVSFFVGYALSSNVTVEYGAGTKVCQYQNRIMYIENAGPPNVKDRLTPVACVLKSECVSANDRQAGIFNAYTGGAPVFSKIPSSGTNPPDFTCAKVRNASGFTRGDIVECIGGGRRQVSTVQQCPIVTSSANVSKTATAFCNARCQWEYGTCQDPFTCGNGIVETGEVCDNGSLNGTYGNCNALCNAVSGEYCGNGIKEFTDTNNNFIKDANEYFDRNHNVLQDPGEEALEYCEVNDFAGSKARGFCRELRGYDATKNKYSYAKFGTSWLLQPSPALNQGTALDEVYALSEDKALAIGERGMVLRTADGGRQWTRAVVPAGITWGLTDLSFADDRHGWLVGERLTVMSTTDGGSLWTRVTTPPVEGASQLPANSSLLPSLLAVDFPTSSIGYVVGQDGLAFKTVDGGLTWVRQQFTSRSLIDVEFINAELGWALESSDRLWRTDDGGKVWNSYTIKNGVNLNKFYFANALRGWAVGPGNAVFKTSDGGRSWTAVDPLAGANISSADKQLYLWSSVVFIDNNNGWIVGSYRKAGQIRALMFKTVDGGSTWTDVRPANRQAEMAGIAFADSRVGWAVGEGGTILKTGYHFCTANAQCGGDTCEVASPSYHINKLNSCAADCQRPGGYCGDGVPQPKYEECDDGNQTDTDSCNNFCFKKLPDASVQVVSNQGLCGDGEVQTPNKDGLNEACDLGSQNGTACAPGYGQSCAYCSRDCRNVLTVQATAYCGNQQLDIVSATLAGSPIYEQCEDLPNNGGILKDPDMSKLLALRIQPKQCTGESWNPTTGFYTTKRGTYQCLNSCGTFTNDCIACGHKSVARGGAIPRLAVLNPLTGNRPSLSWGTGTWAKLRYRATPGLSPTERGELNVVSNVVNSSLFNLGSAYTTQQRLGWYTPTLETDRGLESRAICDGVYALRFNSSVDGDYFNYPVAGQGQTIDNEYVVSPALPPGSVRAVVRWTDQENQDNQPLFTGGVYALWAQSSHTFTQALRLGLVNRTSFLPAVPSGGVKFVSGYMDQAYSFSGASDLITVPDRIELDFAREVTFETWVKPETQSNNFPTIGAETPSGNPDLANIAAPYSLFIEKRQDKFAWRITKVKPYSGVAGPARTDTIYSTTNVSALTGRWVHLAGTYDGSMLRLYINGVQEAGDWFPLDTSGDGIVQSRGPFTIGNYAGGQFQNGFNGLIDEISLYNRALSAQEIKAVFDAGQAGKCKTATTPSCLPPFSNGTWQDNGMRGWWDADGLGQGQKLADKTNLNVSGICRSILKMVESGLVVSSPRQGYWVPDILNCQSQYGAIMHDFARLNKTFIQALTVNTTFGPSLLPASGPYAFFVEAIANLSPTGQPRPIADFKNSNLQVEVYEYHSGQNPASIYQPTRVFKIKEAAGTSSNRLARYWHVFNLVKDQSDNFTIQSVRDEGAVNLNGDVRPHGSIESCWEDLRCNVPGDRCDRQAQAMCQPI